MRVSACGGRVAHSVCDSGHVLTMSELDGTHQTRIFWALGGGRALPPRRLASQIERALDIGGIVSEHLVDIEAAERLQWCGRRVKSVRSHRCVHVVNL